MPAYLQLNSDVTLNVNWTDRRLAVGAALLILYLIHFIFIGLTYLLSHNLTKTWNQVEAHLIMRKIYLYGIASLFSINYVQGGAGVAVFAWITLPTILVLHLTIPGWLSDIRVKNFLWIVYYCEIFIWFFIIVGDFYVTNNDKTNKEITSSTSS